MLGNIVIALGFVTIVVMVVAVLLIVWKEY
jgi:hypothetical protein